MLKETYFGALKKVREDNPSAEFIVVSLSRPAFAKNMYDRWYRALAPKPELLKDYKAGKCDWDEYTDRFKAQIKDSDTAMTWLWTIKDLARRKDVFLICWEGEGKNCHRHILIDIINTMGKPRYCRWCDHLDMDTASGFYICRATPTKFKCPPYKIISAYDVSSTNCEKFSCEKNPDDW